MKIIWWIIRFFILFWCFSTWLYTEYVTFPSSEFITNNVWKIFLLIIMFFSFCWAFSKKLLLPNIIVGTPFILIWLFDFFISKFNIITHHTIPYTIIYFDKLIIIQFGMFVICGVVYFNLTTADDNDHY